MLPADVQKELEEFRARKARIKNAKRKGSTLRVKNETEDSENKRWHKASKKLRAQESAERSKKKTRIKEKDKGKSDFEILADEIITPTVVKRSNRAKAKSEFLKLPKAQRIKIKRGYKARGDFFTFTDWYEAVKKVEKDNQEWSKAATAHIKDRPKKNKNRNDDTIQSRERFVALMQPMVIVPDDESHKAFIADAGSIVLRCEQLKFYRNRVSPITGYSNETLIKYGTAKEAMLGWLAIGTAPAQQLGINKILKPVQGPTFLVRSRDESIVNSWDALRLKIAKSKTSLIGWLATHGEEHSQEIRTVIRDLGGKTYKNEPHEDRFKRLVLLILNTEIDEMPKAQKKTRKTRTEKGVRKVRTPRKEKEKKQRTKRREHNNERTSKRSTKVARRKKSGTPKPKRMTLAMNDHVIKRLEKPNFYAGSSRADQWDLLRKGMTVSEFVDAGGARNLVGQWEKLKSVRLIAPRD